MTDLAPAIIDRLQRLRTDLPYFSKEILKIRTKSGEILPFKLNRPQMFLHQRLEEQRAKTGRVRAIVVKGRQLGASTYLQGRYYHRLWRSKRSLRAFILTHEQAATDNLFGMAQRFYELHGEGLAKPPVSRGNAKELLFGDNDCGYQVSTAGSKETGRSATFQLFHGSECAFWPNAEDHVTASFQSVGDSDGTEIVLESTANGVANLFYRLAQAAIRGESEFIAVFIPWYWGEDYVASCPSDWQPSPEWYEYARAHDLSWEQLYWAFLKNRQLANSISASADEPCWKFKQEYPATFDEAFQSSGNSFIPATSVLRARRPKETIIGTGPVILGVDPARSGDKVGIIDRCGRRMGERISLRMDPGGSSTYVANQIAAVINRIRPDVVNIDIGYMPNVYDQLMDDGYGDSCQLNAINFGSDPISRAPTGEKLHVNRRAEMYDEMRLWFDGDLPVQIPDDDSLQGDICAAQWGAAACRFNRDNELIMETKDEIKARIGASPDLGDAAALTFATPFAVKLPSGPVRRQERKRRSSARGGY